MYRNNKILITICARGGSKGVPGKNLSVLQGKPLLAHTITQAQAFRFADRIVVSTEDQNIKACAEQYGVAVPFLRPKALATDSSGRVPAVIHAVKKAEKLWSENYDIVIDLGNVSPLRTARDIEETVKKLISLPNTDIVYSVNESHRNPYFNLVELNSQQYSQLVKKSSKPILRRQDAPITYDMNDAVYAIWKKALYKYKTFRLKRTRVYVMPKDRSIDIDTPFDLELARYLLEKRKT